MSISGHQFDTFVGQNADPMRGAITCVRAGAAVAAALICLAVALTQPASGAAQAAGNTSVLCIAADGVLHAASPVGTCAPAQKAVALATPATTDCDTDPLQGGDCKPPAPEGSDDLAALDYRLKVLEKRPLFEVIDKNSRPIFQVAANRAVLMNTAGARMVELRVSDNGGMLIARNLADSEVVLGVTGPVGGLTMTEGGVKRIQYGKQPAGNVSMLFSRGSTAIAGIGESRGLSGALVVSDQSGRPRALMSLLADKGSISIQNATAAPVLALTESASRAGLLAIGDATSEPMVKFGVNDDRYGVVLAGPVSGFPLVPNSGMPGSYFLGCAGGDKCGPGGGNQ
jgi:hypothetical protein